MLRCAGLMSALAALLSTLGAAPPALRPPALQLLAAMSADPAAVAEFAARGGVIAVIALVCSDAPAVAQGANVGNTASVCCQAAAVLGRLAEHGAARNAIWAAGGGSLLLPALPGASPLALSGAVLLGP